jgi:hypothetical protein
MPSPIVRRSRKGLVQGNAKDTPTTSAACIDAETLAAWADGSLSTAEAAAVEVHLADCDRCTAMLATFARTIPAAPAPESIWKRWHLRWLVPVATAATVVSLYVLIPRQPSMQIATIGSAPTTESQAEPAAQTPAAPQPAVQTPAPASVSPAQPVQSPGVREQDRFAKREDSPRLQQRLEGRVGVDANAAQPTSLNESVAIAPPARELEGAETKLADAQSERFSPPPTAKTPAPASAPAPAAAPPPAAGATSAFSPDTGARARTPASARETTVFEVQSPNPMTRWRASGAGRVERSTDGGARWQPATLPESATLTGGSSPSPSICWLAGRSGAIYLTTDGLRFTRVPFVDRSDFVSIQAIDARRATVVTIDGRTMRTEDQGATWVRVTP